MPQAGKGEAEAVALQGEVGEVHGPHPLLILEAVEGVEGGMEQAGLGGAGPEANQACANLGRGVRGQVGHGQGDAAGFVHGGGFAQLREAVLALADPIRFQAGAQKRAVLVGLEQAENMVGGGEQHLRSVR